MKKVAKFEAGQWLLVLWSLSMACDEFVRRAWSDRLALAVTLFCLVTALYFVYKERPWRTDPNWFKVPVRNLIAFVIFCCFAWERLVCFPAEVQLFRCF